MNSFAEVQNEVLQERPGQRPEEVEERTYAELGKGFDLDPAMLKEQLPLFAQQLKKAPNATRKHTEYADSLKRLRDAEKLTDRVRDAARPLTRP